MSFCNRMAAYPHQALKAASMAVLFATLLWTPVMLGQMDAQERRFFDRLQRTVDQHQTHLASLSAAVAANTRLIRSERDAQKLRHELLKREMETKAFQYGLGTAASVISLLSLLLWRVAKAAFSQQRRELAHLGHLIEEQNNIQGEHDNA